MVVINQLLVLDLRYRLLYVMCIDLIALIQTRFFKKKSLKSAEIVLILIFAEIARRLLLKNMILIMFLLSSRDPFLLQYRQLSLYFRYFIRVQTPKSADQKNADKNHSQKKWNLQLQI
jgi:hypothetical protein